MTTVEKRKHRRDSSISDLARAKSLELKQIAKALKEDAPEWVQKVVPFIEATAPALGYILACVDIAMPYVISAGELAYGAMKEHEEIFYGSVGFILCFFGGVFPALILAVETYYQCGWDRTEKALMDLYNEGHKVKKKFDEEKLKLIPEDKDGDGEPDLQDIKFSKKMDLFFRVVDPKKCQDAISVLSSNWLVVVAALNIYFAKVIALGNGIGEVIQKSLTEFVVPVLKAVLPKDYHRWIPVLVGYVSRIVGITIAWTAQAVLSAAHSGVRGGTMMARMFFQFQAKQKGKKYHEEESQVDEIIGFALGATGMFLQISFGFQIPFPIWLFTWPFSMLEWWIRITLSNEAMF
mmetsp:Transcript_22344/g.31279  ORF Transcript_22344/g.31279 Transcript_22344/m.31279 type:complete len:350 (-) Transcript_22344:324-1373(-)|eukprot:CAMPEP_0184488326 /NCGR_PEP_ID=MMETSP0113_2-20130426/11268_1 /TAXON_ID=91329 /ORGANISM="Norrisiella sphaerica, Strain BC52" /LENGTH=349 /DNA_ID=CAMNT_0026870963 /DNA_START=102 /DNA_END=1151 /DNA_ORIENTATION=-